MYLSSGNPIVDEMAEINISGNIIPQTWYGTILRPNGKPYLLAIVILSDIVYWYRPTEMRDEQSGRLVGWKKKFKADLLQKSYQQYADLFGESKRSVKAAMDHLQELGVVKRVGRDIQTEEGAVLYNVTFLELNVTRLRELTFPSEEGVQNNVWGDTKFCTSPYKETDGVVQKNVPGPTKECTGVVQNNVGTHTKLCTTNTENTTKTTTENSINQEKVNEEEMSSSYQMYEKIVKENVGYDCLIEQYKYRKTEIDELIMLITDTIAYDCKYIHIGEKKIPHQDVKSRFLKLTKSHLEYVLDSLEEVRTKIGSSYGYNLTTLFNAPVTMTNHYRALVNYHNS